MRGRGCNHCHHSGYRGRIGIFEMMRLTSHIREMTFAQAPTQTLRKGARATGMRTLLEDGIIKALKGSTTLDEVLSTCHAEINDLTLTSA
jgi:type IV pilus assembly protein PilB